MVPYGASVTGGFSNPVIKATAQGCIAYLLPCTLKWKTPASFVSPSFLCVVLKIFSSLMVPADCQLDDM